MSSFIQCMGVIYTPGVPEHGRLFQGLSQDLLHLQPSVLSKCSLHKPHGRKPWGVTHCILLTHIYSVPITSISFLQKPGPVPEGTLEKRAVWTRQDHMGTHPLLLLAISGQSVGMTTRLGNPATISLYP